MLLGCLTNVCAIQAPNGAEASPEPSNHVSEDEGDLFISFDLDDAAPDVPSTSVPAQDTTVIVQPAEPPWARAAAAVDLDSHLLQLHNGACVVCKRTSNVLPAAYVP